MGARGEGWVIGQFVLGAAIVGSALVTRVEIAPVLRVFGIALMLLGGIVVALGGLALGANLTVFPKPKSGTHALITRGIYGLVRHPIYLGGIVMVLGWSLAWGTLLGLALTVVIFFWVDQKARREEAWLTEKYPEYAVYQTRVKKLIPFVY